MVKKKIVRHLKGNSCYLGVSYLIMGMGLGVLFTYPIVGKHPVRWGAGLLALGLFAYLWPVSSK